MSKPRGIIDEGKLIIRQGHQVWHAHQALKKHEEAAYISELAEEYKKVGRIQTVAEGMVLAGAFITCYRSNEADERVPQRVREKMDAKVAEEKAAEAKLKRKGA